MSLKFNDAIEVLLQKLPKMSDNIKPEYIEYADQISKQIYQALEDMNSIFKGTLTGLNRTCVNNEVLPDFWYPLISINMPFNIDPERGATSMISGVPEVACKLKTSTNHPAIENGHVSCERLWTRLYLDLNRAVEKINKFNGTKGEIFKLGAILRPNGFIEISAKDETLKLEILFNINSKVQFSNSSQNYTTVYYLNSFHETNEEVIELKVKNSIGWQNVLFHLKEENPFEMLWMSFEKGSRYFATPLLEGLANYIPLSKSPQRVTFICRALQQLKEWDSVKMEKFMEIFLSKVNNVYKKLPLPCIS